MTRVLFLGFFMALAACAPDEGPATAGAVRAVPVAEPPAVDDGDAVEIPITEVEPAVPVVAQDLAYGEIDDRLLVGYFVLPADAIEPLPGIIMIHEWWGLTDDIRALARRLSGEGYAVLAVDLYGGETATQPAEAQALMSAAMSDRGAVLDNVLQAHNYLVQFASAPRTATLGWALGGGWALEAGIALSDAIDAVVMYYGQVINDDERLAPLNAPLLGLFAELDQTIPVRDAQRFRSRLRDLGKVSEVLIFTDVEHAFANPTGNTYNHAAAEEAWDTTLEFLDRRLR